jgi:hypothetical protein
MKLEVSKESDGGPLVIPPPPAMGHAQRRSSLRGGVGWAIRSGWTGIAGLTMLAGVILAGAGLVLTLAVAPVDAASVGCNGSLITSSLEPGDSGSCTFSYSETAAQLGNPFTVTVSVATTSISGSGAAATGTATEALLDGQPNGLQVTVTDSSGNTFGAGTISCSGAYPYASSCSSSDPNQAVPGTTGTSSWTDTFTIGWKLPLAAGNPYQGGSAVVTVTPFYNGIPAPSPSPSPTPTGGVAGASTGPTPAGGAPASTPPTGAGPIPTSSLVLIALGMLLLLVGAYGIGVATHSRRQTP